MSPIAIPFATILITYDRKRCQFSRMPRPGDLVQFVGQNANSLTTELDDAKLYRVLRVQEWFFQRLIRVDLLTPGATFKGERMDVMQLQIENQEPGPLRIQEQV